MRLFIAVDVSKEVHDYLISLQNSFPDVARYVFPESFHLTLKFLGEVSSEKVEIIKEKLAEVKFQSFSLSLSEIGVFPSFKRINVVWIGVSPQDPVLNLQKQIDQVLQDIFPNNEKFIPHLTLARVKYVNDKKELISFIKKLPVEKLSFSVSEFKLYSSTLTPEGAVHKVEKVFSI